MCDVLLLLATIFKYIRNNNNFCVPISRHKMERILRKSSMSDIK